MRRALSHFLMLLAIVIGSLVAATPAEAKSPTTTHLCQGFKKCAKAGWSGHGYLKERNITHWGARAGINCTNYAAYMLNSRGRLTAMPEGTRDARTWAAAARKSGHTVTGRPRAGDIAYWTPSKSRNIGVKGHVGYVERVNRNGSIVLSHDNWNKTFVVTRLKRRSTMWPTGFIRYAASDGSPAGTLRSVGSAGRQLTIAGSLTDPDAAVGSTSAVVTVVWGRTSATTVAGARQELGAAVRTTTTPPLPANFHWNFNAPRSGQQDVTIYAQNQRKGEDRLLGTYSISVS
jgi:surface antigen